MGRKVEQTAKKVNLHCGTTHGTQEEHIRVAEGSIAELFATTKAATAAVGTTAARRRPGSRLGTGTWPPSHARGAETHRHALILQTTATRHHHLMTGRQYIPAGRFARAALGGRLVSTRAVDFAGRAEAAVATVRLEGTGARAPAWGAGPARAMGDAFVTLVFLVLVS